MSIFKKSSKKRQEESVDSYKIVVRSKQPLSDEQINAISTIIDDGISHNVNASDLAIQIMTSTGIFGMVIINRLKNGDVEVVL